MNGNSHVIEIQHKTVIPYMNIEKDGCSVVSGNSFEVYSMVRMMIMLVSGRKTVRGIRVRVEAI